MTDDQFTSLERKLSEGFAAIDRRFVALEGRMDAIEHRMEGIEKIMVTGGGCLRSCRANLPVRHPRHRGHHHGARRSRLAGRETMTDDALDKRLTLIEQQMEHMQGSMAQRFAHMEESNNLRFEHTVTRTEFYWGLLVQAGLLTGVMGVMLGLFDYGGQP